MTESPRAWRARIGELTANAVIAALQPIPPLSGLHHPTPHRPNDKPRQLFTAADLLADDRALKLLEALETASPHAVAALDELLSDKFRSFEPELVRFSGFGAAKRSLDPSARNIKPKRVVPREI